MTIELKPGQEAAIQLAITSGAFRSVDEFIDTAIAALPNSPVLAGSPNLAAKPSRLWDLRKGLSLGDLCIKDLIEEGRE